MQTSNPPIGIRTFLGALLAIALAFAMFATTATAADEAPDEDEAARITESVIATFGDETLDLSKDWGDARACMVLEEAPDEPECFRSEAEMDVRLTDVGRGDETRRYASIGQKSAFANCWSSLRLYDGGWYTGQVLYLSTRNAWLNLSNYGFNQKTSSFKIGACDSYLADFNNGGGAWYNVAATRAWQTRGSMGGGWNNDVSSVFLK